MSVAENSGRSAKMRGRPFLPGQSGNPGGRPAYAQEIRDLARSHSAEAIATIVEIMQSGSERGKLAAAVVLLDRAVGRTLDSSPPASADSADLQELSDEEFSSVRAIMLAARKRREEQRPSASSAASAAIAE